MKGTGIFSCMVLALMLSGCYGVNSTTSEIAPIDVACLDGKAWELLCAKHSIEHITKGDAIWQEGLEAVQSHFITPKYVLYFNEEPREIIGCDYYAIRVAYNPEITDQALSGNSPLINEKEKKKIRNRIYRALMEYQCDTGKQQTLELMER